MATMSPEQQTAIDHGEGPLVINAGAGSGKTRVLVHRVARLISEGEAPESIVLATFTTAAAEEMKSRLATLVGDEVVERLAHVGTLHSLGYKFYRQQKGKRINAGKYGGSLLSPSQVTGMVRGIVEAPSRYCPFGHNLANDGEWGGSEYGVDMPRKAGKIAKAVSKIMDQNLTAEQYLSLPDADPVVGTVYKIMERLLDEGWAVQGKGRDRGWKRRQGGVISVTFSCMGIRGLAAAKDDKVREAVIGRVKWVFVDEAQDCNPVQFGLMRVLASQTSNLTMVGDDDQSIYSFRGAVPAEFIAQTKGEVTVVNLGTNYRSRRPIVEAAARLIAHNKERLGKEVAPHRDHDEAEGVPVEVLAG